MSYIKNFADIQAKDKKLAGGKGASLVELVSSDFRVPDGFVVLTPAYELFMSQAGLRAEVEEILSGLDTEDLDALDAASSRICSAMMAAEVPEALVNSIKENFSKLNHKYVAVRSSATAEDGAEAAWAGQLDTYLNVAEDGLVESVKKCWTSLFSARSISYRRQNDLQDTDISVAVVVQAMVNSESAGIAFSVHPISEDPDIMVLEAGFGLGELVVSGQITPDNYVVRKSSLSLLEKTLNKQEKFLTRDKTGGTRLETLPTAKANSPKLSDKEILRLAALVKKVEAHYGYPCDIEWAKVSSDFYLLQCRPITTIHRKRPKITLYEQFLQQNDGDKITRVEGDFMPFQLMVEWWNHYDKDHGWQGIYPSINFFTPQRTTIFLSIDKYRGIALQTFGDLVEGRRSLQDIEREYKKYFDRLDKTYRKHFLKQIELRGEPETFREFVKVHDDFQQMIAWTLFYEQLDESAVGEVLSGKGLDLDKIWAAVKLPAFVSFDIRRKELMLSVIDGKLPARYLCYAFSDYTFLADEQFVSEQIAKADRKTLEQDIQNAKAIAAKAEAQLKHALQEADPLTRRAVKILQWVLFCRDERKDGTNRAESLMFYLGGKLFNHWGLDKDFLRYCGISEILQGRDHVKSVADALPKRAKDGFCVLYGTDRIGIVGYDDLKQQIDNLDQLVLDQLMSTDGDKPQLHGEIGNRGQVSGRVRIIRKRQEFSDFKDGEILVTGMTRPEFVPLMEKAAGIITDEGGITSHAAIVSRELDKPCIIGTKVATQLLKTGDMVHVDADIGIVNVMEAPEQA